MILVDTNILLRLITGDVPELAQQAADDIVQATGELVVPDYVMAEVATVLEFNKYFLWRRAAVAAALEDILAIDQLRIAPKVRQAVALYKARPKLDFVDCLLAISAGGRRENLMTFDKELLKAVNKA